MWVSGTGKLSLNEKYEKYNCFKGEEVNRVGLFSTASSIKTNIFFTSTLSLQVNIVYIFPLEL